MPMDFPTGHSPRYSNFYIDGILDETLREGSERCMFSISTDKKMPLIMSIIRSGVNEIIFGSGPDDPKDMSHVIRTLDGDGLLASQKFSFILLLNCFEPLMAQFESFPSEARDRSTISFGMITHDTEKQLFERTLERFRNLGFTSFRVSLLNNFGSQVDEETYERIGAQIDRTRSIGVDTIRINDSLGTLYPEATAILAANLRRDYPSSNFCLHVHDDRGFGLQNALISIYHGFNMIEGGFGEFGNRSGLPAIELLAQIFTEKNIEIRNAPLNHSELATTAILAEETFLSTQSLFRPNSGHLVDCENMGVTNIPDYLGASSASRYFLNRIGLHQPTLERILRDLGINEDAVIPTAADLRLYLEEQMRETTIRKSFEYRALRRMIDDFYDDGVLFSERVYDLTRNFLRERSPSSLAA